MRQTCCKRAFLACSAGAAAAAAGDLNFVSRSRGKDAALDRALLVESAAAPYASAQLSRAEKHMEKQGIEPWTSCMLSTRSTN